MAESDDRIAPSTDSDDSQDGLFRSSDYFIAVMGVTGVGKSTFINHLSNKNVEVGHTLKARESERQEPSRPALTALQVHRK